MAIYRNILLRQNNKNSEHINNAIITYHPFLSKKGYGYVCNLFLPYVPLQLNESDNALLKELDNLFDTFTEIQIKGTRKDIFDYY